MTDSQNFTPDPAIRRGLSISQNGLALIKECEGFSAAPYLCPAGKLTIGYGHVIARDSGLHTPFFNHITEEEAQTLLLKDLVPVETAIAKLVTRVLTQNQYDALCSLIYNIGTGNFEKSTLLKCLNLGNEQGAAAQFSRWVYGAGKPISGLITRRAKERKLFDKTDG